jgi:antirestriction protein ArdC
MNIYELVTDRILKQLEAGQAPWRKTWTTRLPKSMSTGKEYRGINILVLGTAGFASRYWVTYREALRLGGFVRKGEKATPVVYWKWRTPEEMAKLAELKGVKNPAPCIPFVSFVFNLEQVDGIARPEDDDPFCPDEGGRTAAQIFEVMPDKPEIVHTGEPCYHPLLDRVVMPQLSQFKSVDHYYSVLFHELTHSTGHPKRLNRFAEGEGSKFEQYSFEELVAEFGAAFLCAFAGIQNSDAETLQTSYIQGWMKAIRADQRLVLQAAAAAQRSADYIRGHLPQPGEMAAAA